MSSFLNWPSKDQWLPWDRFLYKPMSTRSSIGYRIASDFGGSLWTVLSDRAFPVEKPLRPKPSHFGSTRCCSIGSLAAQSFKSGPKAWSAFTITCNASSYSIFTQKADRNSPALCNLS